MQDLIFIKTIPATEAIISITATTICTTTGPTTTTTTTAGNAI